jgi:DUF971 family protein
MLTAFITIILVEYNKVTVGECYLYPNITIVKVTRVGEYGVLIRFSEGDERYTPLSSLKEHKRADCF